jgi:DNA-binding response OmpR family regulator
MEQRADILIIEDDRDLVSIMRIVLESRQFQVREAYDGKQGYARIEEKTPDLIILDVMMSTETEGFDLAYKLKNTPAYQKVPILMLTSFPKKMMEEGSEKFQHLLGEYWPVAQFLEKPVEPRELLSAVESLIARTQAPPENVLDPAP